jgi:hypothetical protein
VHFERFASIRQNYTFCCLKFADVGYSHLQLSLEMLIILSHHYLSAKVCFLSNSFPLYQTQLLHPLIPQSVHVVGKSVFNISNDYTT